MAEPIKKPDCPVCGKQMKLVSTGSMVRSFYCYDCKEIKIVKRETNKENKEEE